MKEASDGRRILYVAHESAPKCLSVLDVTDPTQPQLLMQTEVEATHVRCNSLDVSANTLAVAHQVAEPGLPGAGLRLFDVSDPANPIAVGFFDTSGPYSRGVHYVWFADGRYAHISSGMPDFQPHRVTLDDQIYVIVDLLDPSNPREAGRWWYPGTSVTDTEPLPTPNAPFDEGCRAHNTNVYPSLPNRAYIGYIDCGVVILDISDLSAPRLVGAYDPSPPTPGFIHTVMPVQGGQLLVVPEEAVEDNCADAPKRLWFFNSSVEERLMPIASAPFPANTADLCARGGRFGAHNIHENPPDEPAFVSEQLVVGSYFNGGVRVYDISDPYVPREVAYFVPEAPAGTPAGAIQINDVYVDNRGLIYAVDRFVGGLYIFQWQMTGP
jgi:hypothetical protein